MEAKHQNKRVWHLHAIDMEDWSDAQGETISVVYGPKIYPVDACTGQRKRPGKYQGYFQ